MIAESEGVDVALVGGVAMQLYGSPRLTGDIDVLSEGHISNLAATGDLTFGGFSTRIGDVPADVIIRNDIYRKLYEEALDYAKRSPDAAVRMKVVTPEYLVAMKIAARRGKDSDDVEYLVTSGILDLEKTRKIVLKHLGAYGLEELNEIVVDSQISDDRQRRLLDLRRSLIE
jgi:hypothetical protein